MRVRERKESAHRSSAPSTGSDSERARPETLQKQGSLAVQRIANGPDVPVADMRLCVDTETVDRRRLTNSELAGGRVGHAFISVEMKPGVPVPETVAEPSRHLLEQPSGTQFGFWPVRHPTAFLPSVDGKVVEPDRTHEAKAWVAYELTALQLESLFKFVNGNRNARYSLYFFNCTTFAVDATRAAGKEPPPSEGLFGKICMPNALYAGMVRNRRIGDKDAKTIWTVPRPGGVSPREDFEDPEVEADGNPVDDRHVDIAI